MPGCGGRTAFLLAGSIGSTHPSLLNPRQRQRGHSSARSVHAPHTLPTPPPLCSSLDQLDSLVSAEVAALAESGPSAEELLRYKKVGGWVLQGVE